MRAWVARSQASGLKVLPSRRPSETDSQRERKKVASNSEFQVKRGPRCLPGPVALPLPPPATEKSSSDMAPRVGAGESCGVAEGGCGVRSGDGVAPGGRPEGGCETEGIRALQAVHWSRAGLRTATGTPSRRGETALAMAMSRARHKTISKIIQGPYPGWTCRIGASSESGRAERMPFCHTGRWSRTSFARLGTCDGEAGTAPTSAVGTETDRLPGAITCPTRQGGWLNAG